MRKILLVEDNLDLAEMIQVMLDRENYEVSICDDPQKCIEQATIDRPGLILMDIMMPQQSGADTVKMLQEHKETKDIPVIFLTGLLSKGDGVDRQEIKVGTRTYRVGAKPINVKSLLKEIKNHIVYVPKDKDE